MEQIYAQLNKDYPLYNNIINEIYDRAKLGYVYKRRSVWEYMTLFPTENEQIRYFNQSFERAKQLLDKEPDVCPQCLFFHKPCRLCE